MTTETETKQAVEETQRSAEAGAAKFPGWNSRRFNYYTPSGKRDLRQYHRRRPARRQPSFAPELDH
jgi:hypothetical protein